MKKKMLAVVLGMVMTVSLMAGCGSKSNTTTGEKETYTIGISQFAEHGSLDNCREGFLAGLAEEGIVEGDNLEVEYKNAAAVTDPVAAELATKDGKPVGEVTGTSDKLPVEEQLKMIREMLPDAKTIGIIYTTSEANSVSAIEEYESKVGDYGFELVTKGVTSVSEVGLAAEDLLTKVDCITNLTDNTVVSALATVLDKANAAKIPVFGSEIEQVKIGCLAAEGLDYVALGKQTGKMAAKVLKGEAKASDLSFELITEAGLYVNTKVAENLGITLDSELTDSAVETYDTIAE